MDRTAHPRRNVSRAPQSGYLVATLGLLISLAGCGTGFGAETVQTYDAGAGVNDRSDGVYVLNALIVANEDAAGTLSVSLLDTIGDGDELTSVTATDTAGEPIEVTQNAQPLPICSTQLTIVGPDAAVTFAGDFVAGETVTLAFAFAEAAPVTIDVPVVARGDSDLYSGVAETPAATTATPEACKPAA